jgi:hypothetical protein
MGSRGYSGSVGYLGSVPVNLAANQRLLWNNNGTIAGVGAVGILNSDLGTGNITIDGNLNVDNINSGGGYGNIYAWGDIYSYYSSDRKLKENIQDISGALDAVNFIGGKTFDWTDDYIKSQGGEDPYYVRKEDFGVIAQDVQAVFPLAVRTRSNGQLAVDYEKLCALAFAAIKELSSKLENIEKKLP